MGRRCCPRPVCPGIRVAGTQDHGWRVVHSPDIERFPQRVWKPHASRGLDRETLSGRWSRRCVRLDGLESRAAFPQTNRRPTLRNRVTWIPEGLLPWVKKSRVGSACPWSVFRRSARICCHVSGTAERIIRTLMPGASSRKETPRVAHCVMERRLMWAMAWLSKTGFNPTAAPRTPKSCQALWVRSRRL